MLFLSQMAERPEQSWNLLRVSRGCRGPRPWPISVLLFLSLPQGAGWEVGIQGSNQLPYGMLVPKVETTMPQH